LERRLGVPLLACVDPLRDGEDRKNAVVKDASRMVATRFDKRFAIATSSSTSAVVISPAGRSRPAIARISDVLPAGRLNGGPGGVTKSNLAASASKGAAACPVRAYVVC
jgi:hypothetical protein